MKKDTGRVVDVKPREEGIEANAPIAFRTVQDLVGHNDVSTPMIYTHVLQRGPGGVLSPDAQLLDD